MEVNEDIELDIENKYIKNKKNTIFTIEEALYILKSKDYCDEVENLAINRIIKYIKEESIPRAVVEEKIEELHKIIIDKKEKTYGLCITIGEDMAKRILQEILNKGE